MANSERLNQHLLRTLLLEGKNGERILNADRTFNKGGKTAEDSYILTDTIKKEITRTTRELMDDKQVDAFIGEVTQQIS